MKDIYFKSKREEKDFYFLEKNIYFEEKDITRNGLNKMIISLSHLTNEELEEVEKLIKNNEHYIINYVYKKICIL